MPITNLSNPLNVNAGAGGSGISGNLNDLIGQVQGQSQQFGSMMTDPSFTGGSEMGLFLKLQREISLEQQMFQTTSNIMKARTDSSKNAISNMR